KVAGDAPRMRQRIDDPTHVRMRPTWVERPDFQASDHVRAMAVPPPGSTRQVLDLIALVEAAPFDPAQPPWEVTVIEGLEGGKAALYVRAHHAMTDGMGGRTLLDLLLDPPGHAPSTRADHDGAASIEAVTDDGSALLSATRKPGALTVTIDLTSAARPV